MKFELILITSPDPVPDEILWVKKFFEAGLKKLHVRKPGLDKEQIRNYISLIPRKYHSRIVLHAHYSLLREFTLGGIHLTEKTRKKQLPACYRARKHSLSASFHSTKEISGSRRKFEYILLSPIFDSISKKGYKSNFKEEELRGFLTSHRNIVALGGIDSKTVKEAKKFGFGGAAMLGYIWEAKDPLKAFQTIRSKVE